MAAGDVTVQIHDSTDTSAVDTAVTALRTGANDKWLTVPVSFNRFMLIHIEEA